jgi:beta-N-acetylhexosaminidase
VEEEAARAGLTLVREEAGALPLRRDAKVALVVIADDEAFPGADATIASELKKRLAAPPTVVRIAPATCDADVERAGAAAAAADSVVLSLFVRARSGRGRIVLPETGRRAIEKVLAAAAAGGRPVVAVSFGSPYVVRDFPAMRTYLAAWGAQDVCQSAAARALFGEAPLGGKLPVSIPGVAARGAGIAKAAAASVSSTPAAEAKGR